MTVRELIETVLEGEELTDRMALQCFLAVAGVLRSAIQGKPATFEDECSAVLALMKHTPYQPTVDGLRLFMQECPSILDLDIPDAVVASWAQAAAEQED